MRRALAFAVALTLTLGAATRQDTTRVVGRHGSWTTTETVDAIDDSVRVTARTEVGDATLVLVCDAPDTPKLLLVLDGTYIDGDSKNVVYRIDKNPPIQGSWSVTFQGSWSRVTGLVSRNSIHQMRSGSKVVIRTWTATNLPETSTFNLAGFTDATRPVLNACDWIPTEKLAIELAEERAREAEERTLEAKERALEERRVADERYRQQQEQRIADYNARALDDALGYGSTEYEGSGVFKSTTELHDEPSMARPLPKEIAAGARVQILRRAEDLENIVSWFFVRVDGVGDYGWILAAYIREDEGDGDPSDGGSTTSNETRPPRDTRLPLVPRSLGRAGSTQM